MRVNKDVAFQKKKEKKSSTKGFEVAQNSCISHLAHWKPNFSHHYIKQVYKKHRQGRKFADGMRGSAWAKHLVDSSIERKITLCKQS